MDAATSFVTPNFIGRDKFYWWIGQVEKSVDTAKNSNRVKCRIIGHHSNREDVPADELPWAQILLPPTISHMSGQGTKSMLIPGQWVMGFFLDGEEAQIPIVWGCLGGISKTDDLDAIPAESFQTPANLWAKPNHVTPGTIANAPTEQTADPTNDMPHHAPAATGEFEDVQDGSVQPVVVAGSALASKGQTARSKEENYKVAVADGLCSTEATKDHMLVAIAEFTADLENAQKIGERWIDTQTGAVINMTNKIQDYSNLMGNMMQSPMASIMQYMESEVSKKFPDVYKAAATANPFELKALKDSQDGILGVMKCAFESGLLDKLTDMFKDMLNDMFGNLNKVVNAADCLFQSITDKIFGQVLDKISGIMDTVKGLMGAIGGAIGQITGVMNKVMGFAKKVLGVLSCVDPALKKCVRSRLFDTKAGAVRPKPMIPDIGLNPDLDNRLRKLAGGPTPICEDAETPKVNTMDVIASAFGIGLSDMDGLEQVGEKLCGFLPVEVITAYNDGTLDIELAYKNTGVTDQAEVNAFVQTLATNMLNLNDSQKAVYDATKALGDIGLLTQFTTVVGAGPEYGISGILKSYFPIDKKHKVYGLDNPFVTGSWVRTCGNPDYYFQVAGTSAYKPKSTGEGGGAWIQLPIDKDGYPDKDAIVYDGGSGYGNGANGNCAPDAFIVTQMYDPETKAPIEDYYLKGTAFIDANGTITAVTFNNENGYVFKEVPAVSVTPCGGDLGDPSSNDAVKDPNTLTNQTDSTLVVSSSNKSIVGIVQRFEVINVGSGYVNPLITITGGGGSGATAECVVLYGRITDIKITNSGLGYTSIPNIMIKDTPIAGEDPNRFKGTSARVYPIIRYMNANDPDLVKKIESEQTVQVVDCP